MGRLRDRRNEAEVGRAKACLSGGCFFSLIFFLLSVALSSRGGGDLLFRSELRNQLGIGRRKYTREK